MANLDLSRLNIDTSTINNWISDYDKFLTQWTWDGNLGTSTKLGNIAINELGLVGGHFVTDDPITTYTPPTSGTSEGQLLVIRGCLEIYLKTNDKLWLKRAESLTEALLKYYYPTSKIPDSPDYKWTPHWLVNVTAPFSSRTYHLNGNAHFINGIANVNYDKVFKIFSVRSTDAVLKYEWAPDAPIVSGEEYSIEHTDVSYGKSKAVIYLDNRNFTGDALVSYVDEMGPIIKIGEKIEAYPVWRKLDTGEIATAIDTLPWALDVFKLLYKATKDEKWQNAINSTTASIVAAYSVDNTEYYLKAGNPEDSVLINGITSYSTRNPSAVYKNTDDKRILINYGSSTGEESIGTWVGNSLEFTHDKYIEARLGTDIPQKVNVSLDELSEYSPDRRWVTTLYPQGLGTNKKDLETFTLKPEDFYKSSYIWWGHGYVADGDGNPSISANSKLSSVDTIGNINSIRGLYKHIEFTRGDEGGWYGWSQFVIVGNYSTLPFDISYRTDSKLEFVIVDYKGQQWRYSLPPTNNTFTTISLTLDDFKNADGASTEDLSYGSYNTMFIDSIDNESSLDIEYIGHKVTMPETVGITNISLGYSSTPELQLAVDYIIPIPKRAPLPYAPYIAPFDMHFINGNLSNDAHSESANPDGQLSDLRGAPYTGYQAPWIFQESSAFNSSYDLIGNNTALETNLKFLSDSQDFYEKNTGLRGFFANLYWWDYRDDANGHPINTFSMTGAWGNIWGGFQYRTISDVARVLYNDPYNKQANKIFLDFITAIDKIWIESDVVNTFPTDFNDGVLPEHSQNDPHMVALLIRALSMGINAYTNDKQVELIYRLINKGLSYLSKKHIPISSIPFSQYQVEGTFSPDTNNNEWYEYWGGDILSSFAHILPISEIADSCGGTSNKYEDYIYGQVPVTRDEYVNLINSGVDKSLFKNFGSVNGPSAIGDDHPENDISIMMESIVEVLEELTDNNKDVQYEYGAGHDSTEYSPYDQGKTRLDEDAFLGWTAYELGYVDSEIAIQPTATILESLIRVSLDSTSDDTEDYKISIIDSTVNIGDIIMFDTPIKNGLAGFYLGSGEFITLFTQDNDDINDIYKLYLWETDEDNGSIVPTEWLSRFNGGVYRTELLDSEAYKWYNSTINN